MRFARFIWIEMIRVVVCSDSVVFRVIRETFESMPLYKVSAFPNEMQ